MKSDSSSVPSDIRNRIVSAAESLLEQSNGDGMPTVDEVRRLAKVDMNAASIVMREWRKAKFTQVAPVVVSVPDSIQSAVFEAAAKIWGQAQELGNENLRNAQAAWEGERLESESLRQELADAYEAQERQLEMLKGELDRAHDMGERQELELVKAREDLLQCRANAEALEAKLVERDSAIKELMSECSQAVLVAQEARDRASRLEGALAATEAQNKALLDTLGKVKK